MIERNDSFGWFIAGAEFMARTHVLSSVFQARTINHMGTLTSMMRMTLFASGTQNALSYQSLLINDSWHGYRHSPAPLTLNECACSTSFECLTPSGKFLCTNGNNCTVGTAIWGAPGLFWSCTSFESMLANSFYCFFDQTCIDKLLSFYNYDMPDRLPLPEATLAIRSLDSSVPSRFAANDTINVIFNQLMIEVWKIEGNFDDYYETCAPAMCTYTYSQRLDIVYVMTTLAGLLGGLTIILRLLCPISVRFVHWMIGHWQQRHTETNGPEIDTAAGTVPTSLDEESKHHLLYILISVSP